VDIIAFSNNSPHPCIHKATNQQRGRLYSHHRQGTKCRVTKRWGYETSGSFSFFVVIQLQL